MRNLTFFIAIVIISVSAYAQGNWTQLTDYAGASRTSAAVFALDTDGDGIDDMGFIACGFNAGSVDYNDMWAYDPQTDTWTQKASLPGVPRRGVTFFVIDNIAYVGAGAYTTAPGNYLNDFYAYDPLTDTWTAIDTLPGDRRWGGYGFSVNGKGYVAMGSSVQVSGTADLDDVYEYDPQTGNWTQKADFPSFPRRGGPSISIDVNGDGTTDRAYIFDGRTNNTGNGFVNEVWEYIPASDTWVQRSSKGSQGLATASAAVVSNKIYLGMGNTSSGENNMFWSYDVNLDTWTFETLFPGTPSRGSHAFTLDNEFYISCGANGNNPMNFTYKYTPMDEYSTICGNIYLDVDSNCINNPGVDQTLEGLFVQANPGPYYGLADSAGNYCVKVPTGNFTVSEVIPASYGGLMTVACPANNEAIVQVDSFGMEIDSVDFANNLPDCPILEVSVTSSVRRYCFNNLYSRIQYCNIGFGDADSVIITYTPSPYITIQGASHPFTTDSSGVMYFSIGTLMGDSCGTITISEQMTCDTDDLGLLSCNGAEISSTTPLCEQPAAWSGGTLTVSVDCSGSDGVEIILTNIGPGNMTDSTDFSVYVDSLLRFTDQVMLDSGESFSFTTAGAGRSIIVMANQEAGYPGGPFVIDWIEACGQDSLITVSTGFVDDYPIYPSSIYEDITCGQIVASFDPNDKLVSPEGLGEEKIVRPGTELDYTIRFQNTGTDTAFTVVIIDTLSKDLDLSTFRITGSSHDYTTEVGGLQRPVVTFTFNNILLPDSNVNEPASHGFISFRIKPYDNTPLETTISNLADIYFDFNAPIRTEPVSVLISNRSPEQQDGEIIDGELVFSGIVEDMAKQELLFTLYPNPNNGAFNLKVDDRMTGSANIALVNMAGEIITSQTYNLNNSQLIRFEYPHLEKGVYLIRVSNQQYNGVARFVVTE